MLNRSVVVAAALGVMLGGGGVAGFMALTKKPEKVRPDTAAPAKSGADDDDDVEAANANLVRSLAECNRRLGDLGQKRVEPMASAPASDPSQGGGRRGGRGREPQQVDWDRHAADGTVPYRIPCIRDTPFAPSTRQADRLGLAPQDVEVLKEAYKSSNARVMADLVPLCAQVVGTKEVAEKIGPQACMNAIMDSARKQSPEKTKEALSRVAEVNGGKRPAPASPQGALPVEALMLAFTKEQKAFEADLAAKLGPEEARRLANARGLCSERGTARAGAPPAEPDR